MAVKKPLVVSAGQIQELQSGDEINIDASDVTTGTIATARLGSGTASATTFLRGDQTWATPAGGVTGFTASQNTASPNNTVNASRLLVDATSTNADFVLQPKGTGAVLAQLPDSATTGGNKRGANALDLQTSRTSASQVASGANSVALGRRNTASSTDSIAIGIGNTSSNSGTIAIGTFCTASGSNALAIGSGTASAQESVVIMGNQSQASAIYSFAFGPFAIADRRGQFVYSNERFVAAGDSQYERYIQRRATTNATQAELTSDGNAPAATTRIGIASDATYTFSALVTARRTDADNESAGYKIEGVIDNNAGTTAFVGTPTVSVIAEDTAAWDVVVEADNTNDALLIKVTGEANKTIRWVAVVELVKVAG